jgi:hypothetical protein
MYFSVNYDFAKIFALNINLKHIAYIGEYQIQIPENSIEISLDELNFELKRELNNYSSILIKDRELCLKCNTKIELIDVSIISRHNEAEEIHNHFKIGDLINDNELKKVPINLLIEIYNFIDKKIKDF